MQSNRLKDNVTPFDVKGKYRINEESFNKLRAFFTPYDKELYRLIGRDLDWERRSWSIFNKKKNEKEG